MINAMFVAGELSLSALLADCFGDPEFSTEARAVERQLDWPLLRRLDMAMFRNTYRELASQTETRSRQRLYGVMFN